MNMYSVGRTLGVENTNIYDEIRSSKKCFPDIRLTLSRQLVKEECKGLYSVKKQRVLSQKNLVSY